MSTMISSTEPRFRLVRVEVKDGDGVDDHYITQDTCGHWHINAKQAGVVEDVLNRLSREFEDGEVPAIPVQGALTMLVETALQRTRDYLSQKGLSVKEVIWEGRYDRARREAFNEAKRLLDAEFLKVEAALHRAAGE